MLYTTVTDHLSSQWQCCHTNYIHLCHTTKRKISCDRHIFQSMNRFIPILRVLPQPNASLITKLIWEKHYVTTLIKS